MSEILMIWVSVPCLAYFMHRVTICWPIFEDLFSVQPIKVLSTNY